MKEEAKIIPEIPKPNKEYKRKEVVINFKIGKEITSNVKVELFVSTYITHRMIWYQ